MPAGGHGVGAEERGAVGPGHLDQGRILVVREVVECRLGGRPCAQRHRPGPCGAVHGIAGAAQGVQGAGPDHHVEFGAVRYCGGRVSPVRQYGVDAHRVLVAEGVPLGVDGADRQHRRLEGVHPVPGGRTGVAGPAGEGDPLHHRAVVAVPDAEPGGLPRRVAEHRHVHIVEGTPGEQVGLADQVRQLPGPYPLAPPVQLDALLGRHGEERHVSVQVLPYGGQADRRADHRRHLGVVAAGVRRTGLRVGERVPGQHQGVEFAEYGHCRPLGTPRHACLYPGEGEPALEGEVELREPPGHRRGGPVLAEAGLRVALKVLAQLQQALPAVFDRRTGPLLELSGGRGSATGAGTAGGGGHAALTATGSGADVFSDRSR